jgi:hypothetical protein
MLAEWSNVNAAKSFAVISPLERAMRTRKSPRRVAVVLGTVRVTEKSFRPDEESLHEAASERRRNVALVRRCPCKTYAFCHSKNLQQRVTFF